MTRTTFQMLLNVIAPRITRLDTRFRNCVPPKKVLALGLFRLAHGNSYISIAPAMNVGKSTLVIEAVQDVVESLFDYIKYIKFPETEQETTALKFAHFRSLPISQILSALLTELIEELRPKRIVLLTILVDISNTILLFRQWLTAEQFLLVDHRMNRKTDDRPFLARFLPGLFHANVNCSFTINWQLFDISNGFCWFQPIF